MWVTLPVGECVVPAVVGDPLGGIALQPRGAGDGEDDAQRTVGLERAVREVAVEADPDAESADEVHREAKSKIKPGESPAPGDRDGHQDGGERKDDERPEGDQDAGALPALGQRFRGGGVDVSVEKRCGHGTSQDLDTYAYVTVTYAPVG